MLNKDRMITGALIGVLLPAVLYTIFHLIMELWKPGIMQSSRLVEKMLLFLIAVNAFLMRHFMVKRDQDRIGRGILLVTFLGAIVYVVFYYTDWI